MAKKRKLSGLPYKLGKYIYIIQCGKFYKIGRTQRIGSRMTDFRVNNPYNVKLLFYTECENYYRIERDLHKILKKFLHRGEWFILNKDQSENVIKLIKFFK